jgi:hypothetical protein
MRKLKGALEGYPYLFTWTVGGKTMNDPIGSHRASAWLRTLADRIDAGEEQFPKVVDIHVRVFQAHADGMEEKILLRNAFEKEIR